MTHDPEYEIQDAIILDRTQCCYVGMALLGGGIMILMTIIYQSPNFSVRGIIGTLVFLALGLSTTLAGLCMPYKIRITPSGVKPISIIRGSLIKWSQIGRITWEIHDAVTSEGVNLGAYDLIKFHYRKTGRARTISYRIWNGNISWETEQLLCTIAERTGVSVEYSRP